MCKLFFAESEGGPKWNDKRLEHELDAMGLSDLPLLRCTNQERVGTTDVVFLTARHGQSYHAVGFILVNRTRPAGGAY